MLPLVVSAHRVPDDMKPPPGPRERSSPLVQYANYFEIGHNAVEVVLDFGYGYDEQHATLHTRIVTPPAYAKALLALLQESLARYEAAYGPPADRAASRPGTDRT